MMCSLKLKVKELEHLIHFLKKLNIKYLKLKFKSNPFGLKQMKVNYR